MLYNLHFFSSKCRLFHNATLFGLCITHILNTACAKIWKQIRRQKVNYFSMARMVMWTHLNVMLYLHCLSCIDMPPLAGRIHFPTCHMLLQDTVCLQLPVCVFFFLCCVFLICPSLGFTLSVFVCWWRVGGDQRVLSEGCWYFCNFRYQQGECSFVILLGVLCKSKSPQTMRPVSIKFSVEDTLSHFYFCLGWII